MGTISISCHQLPITCSFKDQGSEADDLKRDRYVLKVDDSPKITRNTRNGSFSNTARSGSDPGLCLDANAIGAAIKPFTFIISIHRITGVYLKMGNWFWNTGMHKPGSVM